MEVREIEYYEKIRVNLEKLLKIDSLLKNTSTPNLLQNLDEYMRDFIKRTASYWRLNRKNIKKISETIKEINSLKLKKLLGNKSLEEEKRIYERKLLGKNIEKIKNTPPFVILDEFSFLLTLGLYIIKKKEEIQEIYRELQEENSLRDIETWKTLLSYYKNFCELTENLEFNVFLMSGDIFWRIVLIYYAILKNFDKLKKKKIIKSGKADFIKKGLFYMYLTVKKYYPKLNNLISNILKNFTEFLIKFISYMNTLQYVKQVLRIGEGMIPASLGDLYKILEKIIPSDKRDSRVTLILGEDNIYTSYLDLSEIYVIKFELEDDLKETLIQTLENHIQNCENLLRKIRTSLEEIFPRTFAIFPPISLIIYLTGRFYRKERSRQEVEKVNIENKGNFEYFYIPISRDEFCKYLPDEISKLYERLQEIFYSLLPT